MEAKTEPSLRLNALWMKHRNRFQAACLTGFGFAGTFSISYSQIFLGLSLFVWLLDWLCDRRLRQEAWTRPLSPEERQYIDTYARTEWIPYYGLMIAWIAVKWLHIAVSPYPLKEMTVLRELWLMLVVPLVMSRLRKEHFSWLVGGFLAGGFLTGVYNLIEAYRRGFSFEFRAGGFHSYLHLTYAGILGMELFLVIPYLVHALAHRRWRTALILAIGLAGLMTGLYLTRSRGVFVALILTTGIFLLLVFRWRFIFILPICLAVFPMWIRDGDRIVQSFEQALSSKGKEKYSSKERLYLWQAGIRMYLKRPLLGTGHAMYKKIYMRYRNPKATGVAKKGFHMHNDMLQILVKYGAFALSVLLFFYFLPTGDFIAHYTAIRELSWYSLEKWLIYGSLCSIWMIFFMGWTQCHFIDDEVQAVFWIAIATFYRQLRLISRRPIP